jgi:hypothetical protein
VLEVQRQAIVLVEAVADLCGEVEKHSSAQRLPIPVLKLQLAVVDRGTNAEAEKEPSVRFELSTRVDVGVARRSDGVDRSSNRRPYGAPRNEIDGDKSASMLMSTELGSARKLLQRYGTS